MLRRLAVNASSNLVRLFINMGVTFVMAPIYIHAMGHYDYGLREMVMAFAGYMGLLGFGMRPTMTRFSAMYHAKRDKESLLVVYASSLVFMSLVGLVIGSVFWGWALAWPQTITPDGGNGTKYAIFLFIVGLNLLFVFPKYVVESYLEGLQLYYIKNSINIIGTLLIATISYVFITPENALILVVGLTATIGIIKLFLFGGLLLRPGFGSLSPRIEKFSKDKLKEMLFFGFKSFVQGIATKITTVSDKVILGSVLGPSAVPIYSIPHTLTSYVNSITMSLTQVFLPFFSNLTAVGERRRIKDIYIMASKYTVAGVLSMCVGIASIGGPFVKIWLPGEFDPELVNGIIIVLATYFAVHRLNPYAGHFLTSINQHGFLAKVSPVGALANLIISIWLVYKIGVIGAALGTLIPAFVMVPLVIWYTCRHLGLAVSEYVFRSILPGVIPVIIMSVVSLSFRFKWGLNSYPDIIMCVLASAIVFGVSFWFLACSKNEKKFLMGHLRRFIGL